MQAATTAVDLIAHALARTGLPEPGAETLIVERIPQTADGRPISTVRFYRAPILSQPWIGARDHPSDPGSSTDCL
jgi:hypothetical protein